MRKRVGKIFYGILGSQLLVFGLSLVYYRELSLLNYINISFYIASILLFISLIVFTVNSGFFDAISYSFRNVFTSKDNEGKKESFDEMTPLSELVTINTQPLLAVGLLDFILMLAALYLYYL
ncbi:DUF3899 domain-containing protein [Mesobacillus subterraneus]|uniref:DUF3899 domain-containing protein n=1 Tax=Mesobacillus subterraneus TaxID=285983 RepID=UPI00203EEA15|nr:DUF3899 domain-containing protein [Mesobacillus subterraneus]MCM3663041.1 DUF3899 domain-containing protein [Mesobacillus subterraneus]MCM3682783.1 DUF3899 domain-containing protein [Mesobacillus subterraneus]